MPGVPTAWASVVKATAMAPLLLPPKSMVLTGHKSNRYQPVPLTVSCGLPYQLIGSFMCVLYYTSSKQSQ